MKNALLLLYLITISTQLLQAQKADSAAAASQQKMYDYYWQKHNKNATTGWVLLGVGLTSFAVGLSLINSASGIDDITVSSVVLAGSGIVEMLVSIPFFISAGNNKRKSRLALKKETVSFGNKYLPNSGYTAFSISLPL